MCTPTSNSSSLAFVPYIRNTITTLMSRPDVKINSLFLEILSRAYHEPNETPEVEQANLTSDRLYTSTFTTDFSPEFTIESYMGKVTTIFKHVIGRIKSEGFYGEIQSKIVIQGIKNLGEGTTERFTTTIKQPAEADVTSDKFEREFLGPQESLLQAAPGAEDPGAIV